MKKIIKQTESLLSLTHSRDTDESLIAILGNHCLKIV